jgi:hypothetical protein
MNPQDLDNPQMWERVIRWREGLDHNLRHMDPHLLEWVLTHHPNWIKMEVNQESVNARIKEPEAQGVEITPDTFPGLTLHAIYSSERFREGGRFLGQLT